MREGLDAPTLELSGGVVDEVRAFLDGQSRFRLAVWVRHEHLGVDGPFYDHHLVLAVDDDDWATGDMRALEDGMQLPALSMTEKTWIDLYPLSEVDRLRSFGTVLWEQRSPGGDPLDYRFTFEPFEPDPEAVQRFRTRLADLPEVRRVGGGVTCLWKGDREVKSEARLVVDAPPRADVVMCVLDAARASLLTEWSSHSVGLGRPDDSMTILYEASA
jgi:hypothetical protein